MKRNRLANKSKKKAWERLKRTPQFKISSDTIHQAVGDQNARFVMMSPEEFISYVPSSRIYDPSFYMTKIAQGKVMYPLYLEVDIATGKLIGHEGRHRAYASWKLGIKHVPVVIEYSKKVTGNAFGTKDFTWHTTKGVDIFSHLPEIQPDPKGKPIVLYDVYRPRKRVKKK